MTEKIYLSDPYIFEFNSIIKKVEKKADYIEVILDSSAFYPESGGQLYDLGTIDDHQALRIFEDENGDVVHCVDSWTKGVGESVIGKIDRDRRLSNMRKHTGQHILSRALIEVTGAETVSSRLGDIESTIEVSKESIDASIIQKAEDLANDVIMTDSPVAINYYDRGELSRLPVRKIPDREGKFRVVQVGEFDYTACGGNHCRRSGEVGMVKIIGQEKLRGHLRLIFLAGKQAVSDYSEKHEQISILSGLLTCHFRDLDKSINRLLEQNTILRRENSQLNSKILGLEIGDLIKSAPEISGIRIIFKKYIHQDMKNLKEAATSAVEEKKAIIILAIEDKLLLAASKGLQPDASALAKIIMLKFGGKGGGSPIFAQVGGITNPEWDKIVAEIKAAAGYQSSIG